jgi:hypothetical protein
MRLILAAVVLMLTACGGALEQEETQAEDLGPVSAKLRTTSSRDPLKWQKVFDVDETNTIFFVADTQGAQVKLSVAIVEPRGNLYQRTEAAPDAQTGRVFVSLPVAGTWVQQFSMTGRWKAKVFIDDAPEAAATAVIILR